MQWYSSRLKYYIMIVSFMWCQDAGVYFQSHIFKICILGSYSLRLRVLACGICWCYTHTTVVCQLHRQWRYSCRFRELLQPSSLEWQHNHYWFSLPCRPKSWIASWLLGSHPEAMESQEWHWSHPCLLCLVVVLITSQFLDGPKQRLEVLSSHRR